MMLLNKLKAVPVVLLVVGLLGLGTADWLLRSSAQENDRPEPIQVVTPAAPADKQAKGDHELIQGEWQLIRMEKGGKVIEEKKIRDVKLIVTKKSAALIFPDNEIQVMSYWLDSSKAPKWINLAKKLDDPFGYTLKEDGFKKTTVNALLLNGIYELNGDTLKIVHNEDGFKQSRPTRFVSQAGTANYQLMIFKRVSPAPINKPAPAKPAPDEAGEEKPLTPEMIVAKQFEGKATIEFQVAAEGTGGIQGGSRKYGGIVGIYLSPAEQPKGGRLRVCILTKPAHDLFRLGIDPGDPGGHFRGKVIRVTGQVTRAPDDPGAVYELRVESLDQFEEVRKSKP